MKVQGGKKCVTHSPYPTERNIADAHAYYICSCKHAHLEHSIILYASSTDYMLFETLNERWERRATAIYGKHCCVTSVLLLECFTRLFAILASLNLLQISKDDGAVPRK